jgi:L-idonate 5-dehydrogenase
MILGHEVAGTVVEVGPGARNVSVGMRVAVNPALPCRACAECCSGRGNLCSNVYFFGSASRFPHVQGAFAEVFLAQDSQCVPISDRLPFAVAACAEPLAVCLHAVRRAGDLLGKRVLVTGAGPIGLLTLMAAKTSGASEVVITDRVDAPLEIAMRLGASRTINISGGEEIEGEFDVAIEAAGALPALTTCLQKVRRGGRVVQLGSLPPEANSLLQLPALVTREVELVGSFRFYEEYALAVRLLESGVIDPTPLLSGAMPLSEAVRAFELASDRRRAVKVSLVA